MNGNNHYDAELEAILAEFSSAPAAPAEATEPSHEAEPTRVWETPQQEKTPRQEPVPEEPVPEELVPEPVVPDGPESGDGVSETALPPEEALPEEEDPEEEPKKRGGTKRLGAGRGFFAFLMALVTLALFAWICISVHPDSSAVTAADLSARLDLTGRIDTYANHSSADILSNFEGVAYIKKIYTIEESATAAPLPNPDCYGTTTDLAEALAVIDSAALLLDGDEFSLNPNTVLFPNSEICYYYDETILMVAWKEKIEGKCVSMAEIKVADGSQIRRKIAGDTYSSSVQLTATTLSTQANAVIGLSGDFYAFRDLGITVYQRKVYRCKPAAVDTAYFTSSGEMLFSRKGELSTKEEAQAFVDANDVLFSLSFGPILIEDGVMQEITSYPIGEINRTYSRTAIATKGDLHYFLMTINYQDDCVVAATLSQLIQFLYDKGCQQAYALDGGQTSTMVIRGETFNRVDWGSERTMSDIIYFATALPEEEVSQ